MGRKHPKYLIIFYRWKLIMFLYFLSTGRRMIKICISMGVVLHFHWWHRTVILPVSVWIRKHCKMYNNGGWSWTKVYWQCHEQSLHLICLCFGLMRYQNLTLYHRCIYIASSKLNIQVWLEYHNNVGLKSYYWLLCFGHTLLRKEVIFWCSEAIFLVVCDPSMNELWAT